MAGMFAEKLRPASAWAQPAILPSLQKLYIAPGWPMEHLMRIAHNLAVSDPRVLDVSLLGGFFCSDTHNTGLSVTVTTNNEPALAQEIAEKVKEACWAKRHSFQVDTVPVAEAVREAIETEEGPVVLGDLPLGGDPSLALESIERGIERSLIHDEHIARHVADALRDRPSVERPEGERLQHEQVQRALEYLDWFAH